MKIIVVSVVCAEKSPPGSCLDELCIVQVRSFFNMKVLFRYENKRSNENTFFFFFLRDFPLIQNTQILHYSIAQLLSCIAKSRPPAEEEVKSPRNLNSRGDGPKQLPEVAGKSSM